MGFNVSVYLSQRSLASADISRQPISALTTLKDGLLTLHHHSLTLKALHLLAYSISRPFSMVSGRHPTIRGSKRNVGQKPMFRKLLMFLLEKLHTCVFCVHI